MPTSTYEPLASVALSSTQSQITLSNIPQNYTDLVLVVTGNAGTGTASLMRFNGDNSTSYSDRWLLGDGTSATSDKETNVTGIWGGSFYNTTTPTVSTLNIMNYSSSTTFKTVISRTNYTVAFTGAITGMWRKTSAINSVTLLAGGVGFLTGTTFNLYGVGANQLKATGGDIIQTDGTYWYHAFLSSGVFTPQTALTCDYLVVAGGGGGGANYTPAGGVGGGGGGAGGLRSTVTATGGGGSVESAISLSANTSYTVTVGAGGLGGTTNGSTGLRGTNGNNSVFSTITSIGGGAGGAQDDSVPDQTGGIGGSGGGSYFEKSGGAGTANQGFAGGAGATGTSFNAGGGGGAGAVGVNANNATPNGGNGVSISQLATITGTGASNYYAGGGGGGAYIGNAGAGGAGGGGAGARNGAGDGGFAIPNTGGGGGGAGYGSASATFGGNGGSGIVIVRYAV
jgi:hypothetical protein